jgi:hypothetical protein
MATIQATGAAVRAGRSRFYVWLTGAMVLVAFGGFTPTFWGQMARSNVIGPPILYIHGLLFSAWVIFLFAQASLVAAGRTLAHRDWGLAGVALATAMAFSVPLVVLRQIADADAAGFGEAARRFAIVPLSTLVFWVVFIGFAFANVRRPETHKRLIIVATVGALQAAVARFFLLAASAGAATGGGPAGPPPVVFSLPAGLVVDLLLVVAIVHDWRSNRRVHPAYIVGGAALLAKQLLIIPLAATPTWLAAMAVFEKLAG